MKLTKKPVMSLLAGVILSAATCTAFAANAENLTVKTDKGTVQGFNLSGINAFRGIPYAKPPVGNLRWMPPVPAKSWNQTRAADQFGNTCATNYTLGGFGQTSSSEDCLYLNVYTPSSAPAKGEQYPVMVWIHGGGLGTGSGNDYDVSKLIEKNVIVVTLNYRLGMFGFFSHPAINAEPHKAINYGILDQQAALKWVQENINEFGGNKDNVTIFGESAGGHSVMAQLISPTAKGLFNKAIVSSGAFSFIPPTISEANKLGEQVAKIAGCDKVDSNKVAECLRAAPTTLITEKGPNYMPVAQVVVDGTIIPTTFTDAFNSGSFNQVPIINGFNSNEGTFFAGLAELGKGQKLTLDDYKAGLQSLMGEERGTKLFELDQPNLKQIKNIGAAYSASLGRAKFICPVPLGSDMLSKHVPVYTYEFADTQAPVLIKPVSFSYGASHTAELQYIFKGFYGVTGIKGQLNQQQQQLSDQMVGYWTNFAKNSNPNGNLLAQWNQYNPVSGATMKFLPGNSGMEKAVADKYNCDELKNVLTQ